MKGIHDMKKSHQTLLRYLNMDILSSLETFKSFVCEESGKSVTVPHRQNLDYILIKLQGLAKLLIRVVECSKNSARFFLGLIKAGSFYMKGVIFLSTLASIWFRSRDLCKLIVEQYNKLIEFREILEEKPGLKWIDGQYELPDTLDTWLGHEYTNLIVNETYDIKLLLTQTQIDEFLERKSDTSLKIKAVDHDAAKEDDKPIQQNFSIENDIEDFTPLPRNSKKAVVRENELEHSLTLTSKDSILLFIKSETHYRKVDPSKSLLISKMKKKAWKEFKEDIKNKSLLMKEETFITFVKDYLNEYKD